MKSGKEIKIKTNDKDFKALAGAVEKYKAPTSIYLNISTWVRVKKNSEEVEKEINKLSSILKREIYNKLNWSQVFDNRGTIIDVDLSSLGLSNGRPAFLSIEINLIQPNGTLPLVKLKHEDKEDLVLHLQDIVNYVLNIEALKNNNFFKYSLKKK